MLQFHIFFNHKYLSCQEKYFIVTDKVVAHTDCDVVQSSLVGKVFVPMSHQVHAPSPTKLIFIITVKPENIVYFYILELKNHLKYFYHFL